MDKLAEQYKLPKVKLKKVVQSLVDMAAEGLSKGNEVQLAGLGVLRVRDVAPRAEGAVETGKLQAERKVVLAVAKKFKIAAGV